MSNDLFRYHLDKYRTNGRSPERKSKVISIASGKGGVGKTFFSTNFAKFLDSKKRKVLLIDCDVYLSNCYLSLGVTPGKDLFDLHDGELFHNCVTKVGGIDLISGRSGNEHKEDVDYVKTILSLVQSLEYSYDYILLDCPAGIDSKILSLMAYCDERIVLMNPNKYSLTDAYSLIKTLRLNYGVKEFKTVTNRSDNLLAEKEINERLTNTCMTFLPDVRIKNIGSISRLDNHITNEAERISLRNNLCNIFEFFNDKEATDSEFYLQKGLEMEFQVTF